MALELTKELDSGVAATYHRVTGLNLDVARQVAHIRVAAYRDQPARQAGKAPLAVETIIIASGFPFTTVAMDAANPIVLAYRHFKSLARYAGASDC